MFCDNIFLKNYLLGESVNLGIVIPFRTRGEWEAEKKEKIKKEWEEWLEFEKKYVKYLDKEETNEYQK